MERSSLSFGRITVRFFLLSLLTCSVAALSYVAGTVSPWEQTEQILNKAYVSGGSASLSQEALRLNATESSGQCQKNGFWIDDNAYFCRDGKTYIFKKVAFSDAIANIFSDFTRYGFALAISVLMTLLLVVIDKRPFLFSKKSLASFDDKISAFSGYRDSMIAEISAGRPEDAIVSARPFFDTALALTDEPSDVSDSIIASYASIINAANSHNFYRLSRTLTSDMDEIVNRSNLKRNRFLSVLLSELNLHVFGRNKSIVYVTTSFVGYVLASALFLESSFGGQINKGFFWFLNEAVRLSVAHIPIGISPTTAYETVAINAVSFFGIIYSVALCTTIYNKLKK